MRISFLLLSLSSLMFAKPILSTSIIPNKFIIEQISKNFADVEAIIPPNNDPHTYEIKPKQLQNLQNSDIYFASNLEIEQKLISHLKNLKNLQIIKIQPDKQDPHAWLDPLSVENEAKIIKDALVKKYPEHKDEFEKNYNEFKNNLQILDGKIKKILANSKNKAFIIDHPSLALFAKRYDLKMFSIEEEEKELKAKDLIKLLNDAKQKNVKLFFQTSKKEIKSSKIIENELKIKPVKIDIFQKDYNSLMLNIAEKIGKE